MIFKIAFRNIFRQKRRSILTALTMFGGFTLAAISIGWSDGTYSFTINMFTRNQLGHIQIHADNYRHRPTIYKTIDDYKSVGKIISQVHKVEAWTPRLFAAGLISVGDKSAATQVTGIDPRLENQATHFDKKIVQGRGFDKIDSHEAILGKGLAKVVEAQVGDTVVIVSQASDGSIANDAYKIVGIISSGNDLSDRMAFYLPLQTAQELFVLNGKVHEIAIIVTNLDAIPGVINAIEDKLHNPNLEVVPWQVFASNFYQAMKADQEGMWIMLFVIILIVAVGVLNTVLMSVLERRREYGLLKAIGTKPKQIFGLVAYETLILSIISIIIGAILSVIINSLLSKHGIPMPQAFTYGGIVFDTMYTEVNARSLFIPALTVIFSAMFISVFPGLKAAHTEPAKAMRMH